MNPHSHGSAGLDDWLAWLDENKTPVIAAVVVAILLGVGLYVYRWQVVQTELKANTALLGIGSEDQTADDPVSADPAAYLRIASDFRSTDAGERAQLLGAAALFTDNKYAEAEAEFQNVLEKQGQKPWAPIANYGLAVSLEAQGKTDEAISSYKDVTTRYPNAAVANQAKLALGRLYAATDQPKEALALYDQLANPAAPTAWSSEALRRKRELLDKHPELETATEPASLSNPGSILPSTTNPIDVALPQ